MKFCKVTCTASTIAIKYNFVFVHLEHRHGDIATTIPTKETNPKSVHHLHYAHLQQRPLAVLLNTECDCSQRKPQCQLTQISYCKDIEISQKGSLTNKYSQPSDEATALTFRAQAHKSKEPIGLCVSFAVKVGLKLAHLLVLLRLLIRVRRVADGEERLHPSRSRRHGAAMGEGVERGAAAVSALSAGADTTESKGRDRGVEETAKMAC